MTVPECTGTMTYGRIWTAIDCGQIAIGDYDTLRWRAAIEAAGMDPDECPDSVSVAVVIESDGEIPAIQAGDVLVYTGISLEQPVYIVRAVGDAALDALTTVGECRDYAGYYVEYGPERTADIALVDYTHGDISWDELETVRHAVGVTIEIL